MHTLSYHACNFLNFPSRVYVTPHTCSLKQPRSASTATTTKALTSQTAGFAKEEAKGKSTDGESRKLHATSKQPTHQHSLHSHKAAKNVCDNARKYATNKRITIICICVCVRIYLHIRRSDALVVRNGARVVAQTAVARTTQTWNSQARTASQFPADRWSDCSSSGGSAYWQL